MKTPIIIIDNIIYADSRIIAEGFGIEHRSLYKLVLNHKTQLEAFGLLRFEIAKPKTGRPASYALLTEEQSLLLLTYTRSTTNTDFYRHKLIKNFTSMRKALLELSLNKHNQEWLSNRSKGKIARKTTTDVIKSFVEYAGNQGSKNAARYYCNISKMENSSIFLILQKFPNLREVMDNRQLSFIESVDTIVSEALREGMEQKLPYKEIYQLAKSRVISLSNLIPKTTIPIGIEDCL